MKKILILGSTGSIGTQTLEVVRQNKNYFQVVGLVCGANISLLKKQISEFQPKFAAVYDYKLKAQPACAGRLKNYQNKIKIFYGETGILELIKEASCDIVVLAIVGIAGLKPALTAIKAGRNLALATKEVIILAGELIKEELAKKNPRPNIFPIDSEHSAIWQSLKAGNKKEIEKIILTCSGGPFRGKKKEELEKVTVEQALGHPTWKMGKRITIDSATLMNKGLEVIEAKWLFDVSISQIEVVVHPQSILHSAVLFCDGSIIGQFSKPDMKIPIQYALSYPKRLKNNFDRLLLQDIKSLTFEKPDFKTFPCLKYGYKAAEVGGTMPVVLNAADEAAVDLFLKNKIKFLDISKIIGKIMSQHKTIKKPTLEEIFKTDKQVREKLENDYLNFCD